jgi:Ice-binding-like/Prealbumin-like fold domain
VRNKQMKKLITGLVLMGLVAVIAAPMGASAAIAPALGAASSFAQLTGSVAPGENGFATQAQVAVLNMYTSIGTQACSQNGGGLNIGGTTMTTGVLCVSSTSTFNGNLTLDAQGNSSNPFLIDVTGNLTFAPSSTLVFVNSAQSTNAFIRVDGNVVIPANTTVNATIIASGSITADASARVNGHLFSLNGTLNIPAGVVSCPECVTNHPTITLNKVVINDNGGLLGSADFTLLVNDMETLSGRTNIVVPGTYTAGELPTAGYGIASFSGACNAGGAVTVALGQNVTCTMTNNDNGSIGLPNTGAGGGVRNTALYAVLAIAGVAGVAVLGKKMAAASR